MEETIRHLRPVVTSEHASTADSERIGEDSDWHG